MGLASRLSSPVVTKLVGASPFKIVFTFKV